METPAVNTKSMFIKTLYLYVVSFVALMMMVISAVDLLSTLLKTYVFTKADNYSYYSSASACPLPTAGENTATTQEKCRVDQEEQKKSEIENREAQRQRDLVRDISFIVVGAPLFAFHWRLARRKEV